LELGVDLGDLDAVLILGFPRSFSSLWQQAGRAGRSGRLSLSILICHDCPVDQFFVRHPSVLLHSSSEPATLNPDNIHILRGHLLCAAKEIPLNSELGDTATAGAFAMSDMQLWGEKYLETATSLLETKDLIATAAYTQCSSSKSDPFYVHPSLPLWRMHPLHRLGSNPTKDVSLRLIDPVTINVMDMSVGGGGVVIDSLGYSRAFYELFEGAIYMHRAQQFLVRQLDLQSKRALSIPVKVGYYTACRNRTDINVLKVYEDSGLFKTGTVQVVCSVYGYAKIWLGTGEVFEEGECSLPNLEFETTALWIGDQ
jgi:DEAD/DEAH box helicase domain-containing protein